MTINLGVSCSETPVCMDAERATEALCRRTAGQTNGPFRDCIQLIRCWERRKLRTIHLSHVPASGLRPQFRYFVQVPACSRNRLANVSTNCNLSTPPITFRCNQHFWDRSRIERQRRQYLSFSQVEKCVPWACRTAPKHINFFALASITIHFRSIRYQSKKIGLRQDSDFVATLNYFCCCLS
jgi:hypothetical protein